jgi:hypothetical protein
VDLGRTGTVMRALFAGLFDDAALFPPGNAPMHEAVPAHLAHRAAWYADLVGPFICPDTRLAELARCDGRMPVSIIVTGGWATVGDALRQIPAARLAAVEIPVGHDTAPTEMTPAQVPVYVEVPWGVAQPGALDALAGTGMHAKLRTGGTTAGAFPTEAHLAAAIAGCLDRELAFKCTAGLHNAVRHTAADTGFEHHGFLNVLLATAALLDGADPTRAAEVLAERSADTLAAAARQLSDLHIARLRDRFRSFGTCSVTEPLTDLTALGLLDPTGKATLA